MKELKTITVYADKVEKLDIDCYSFKRNESGFDQISKICDKCKYFDQETDFPNCFCDKSCELIDFYFCSPTCPLKKWKIEQIKEH